MPRRKSRTTASADSALHVLERGSIVAHVDAVANLEVEGSLRGNVCLGLEIVLLLHISECEVGGHGARRGCALGSALTPGIGTGTL